MFPATVVMVGVVLLASVAIALLLRSWVFAESRMEGRLHDPGTPTVAYAIPNGVDPAVVMAALRADGFASVLDRIGDTECLIVECDRGERTRVRSVIEHVHASSYDGSALKLDHVVFEDER